MIISVSGGSILKSGSVALLGLLIATVGMDPMSGFPRFIFGNASLMEGIPFIPVLIGLFALAEVLRAVSRPVAIEQTTTGGTAWPSASDT